MSVVPLRTGETDCGNDGLNRVLGSFSTTPLTLCFHAQHVSAFSFPNKCRFSESNQVLPGFNVTLNNRTSSIGLCMLLKRCHAPLEQISEYARNVSLAFSRMPAPIRDHADVRTRLIHTLKPTSFPFRCQVLFQKIIQILPHM